jgi:ATP-dependent Lon protease
MINLKDNKMSSDESTSSISSKRRKVDNNGIKDRLRNSNNKKRSYYDSSNDSSDVEEEEEEEEEDNGVITLDISDILAMAINSAPHMVNEEETENEKYLKTLPKSKRMKFEREEEEIVNMYKTTKPLKYKILESNLPRKTKALVLQKVERFEKSNSGTGEFNKLKNYMDRLIQIPFGVYHDLPVQLSDGREVVSNYLNNIKWSLDACIHGQETAKIRLMEVAAKWITNPDSGGSIIGLCGPPGVGKTTLIKKGLSKAMDIPFAFMPLGGCSNPAILEGHDYTYEGSKNGKMVDILIEQKCMNPIIFFDELDKLGTNGAGVDISGMLTHLTDFTQNDSIHDRYFADIEFDFSKCLFIFSFNDETKINPILRDRITIINMKGFNKKEKMEIAKTFTTPKVAASIGIPMTEFKISDTTYEFIIDNYCSQDQGIRKMEKCIETLLLKINLFKLTCNEVYIENVKCDHENIDISKKMASKILNKFFNVDEGADMMARMMYN